MEFAVWTELIQQSRGLLHVFLPLLDNGLDAVVHRLTDGAYIPIQVKGRSQMVKGKQMIEVIVLAESLVNDSALIIAGLLTDEGLGPTLLVIDEGVFKRLASHDTSDGFEVYAASFSMHPTAVTRWGPYLVPREDLAARLLGGGLPAPGLLPSAGEMDLKPADRHNEWLGFLGESEVVRRLAENSELDLFRPFPDLEMVEVLAIHNVVARFAGLQVKTAVPDPLRGEAKIHVQKGTFVAAPSTWVVGLAWQPALGRFAEECLLVPTERLREIATDDGDRLLLKFRPESRNRTRLDPYRQKLSDLGGLIARITATT